MAEHHPAGPTELGAPMDYAVHERTYESFLSLVKIVVLASVVTVLALGLFAFGRGGFWLGFLLLVAMVIATGIGIVGRGTVRPLAVVAVIGFLLLALFVG